MPSPLDTKLCQELAQHIEALTHTGQKVLEPTLIKKIKQICRSSEGYVEHAYHLLLHQLGEQHAEVRFSAFQIIDELFRRSHSFREHLVSDMQRIMELTVETNPNNCLPPPKIAASNLKNLALRSFHEWNVQYGSGYKRLQIGYNFLRKCKNIDFDNLEFENAIERARREENLRHQQIVNEEKIQKVLTEYNDLYEEIKTTITSLDNCIKLLVPSLDDFFISCDNMDESDIDTFNSELVVTSPHLKCSKKENKVDIREHGMNTNFSVEVEIKPVASVKETAENAAVFENARDAQRLIKNRYIPRVKNWLKVITKCSGKSDDVKKMVNLKDELEKSLKKCDHLDISRKNSDDSSDSDLEEVPDKEGYEEHVVEQHVLFAQSSSRSEKSASSKKDWSIFSKDNNEEDPTTLLSTLSTLQTTKNSHPSCSENSFATTSSGEQEVKVQKTEEIECLPSTSHKNQSTQSRKQKLLSVAPKLPFDIDLYHWEEEKLAAPTMLLVKPDGARFWSATSTDEMEEIVVPEGAASLRTRVIEFSGRHEPVKWACRAPLPSGKLCPRRDRYKCPFHGPVVARDSSGKCSNPEDEARLKQMQEEEQQKNPDWQDPKLLQEIKEATGVDLKMPEKGKRKKKSDQTKYPGLTDIKAKQNNAYTRLAKKVFKKGSMKRIAQSLDNADHKRFRDKYGDQFNYVHETS
ncbi:UV-stimulated scaffold protein A [Gryllus bimaculatus]|nr:UV-stimulated scaffold protein A [Gryllus bimaculatus]